ncbi:MAG: aldehyde dehydrogenase family protein, partial [Caulobacter sp.]|nr:aldehyde dehydrogenase family protein [Caulobacter sp.]
TPWNFPLNQVIRKVGPALATGCSIVVKASEETPATAALLVRAFHDAGLPAGVLNLVFGDPEFISQHLIASPVIKKVSFTGSTVVGKKLAALAGAHMKRVTMELGGHAPALIFNDADVERAAKILASNKYRNSGQSCISPTRILVEAGVYERFVSAFVREAGAIELGHGMDPATLMGPVITERRLRTLEALLSDAKVHGARVACGGQRLERPGHYLQPTVLTDVPIDARILNEEPFGPVAVITPFTSVDDAVSEANRLPYGLAAYAFTTSLNTGQFLGSAIEAGMVSVNSHGLGHPETPFGGVKDSGYGSEGGLEALDNYLNFKFVSLARG